MLCGIALIVRADVCGGGRKLRKNPAGAGISGAL